MLSSPRGYFNFKVFGAKNIRVLNGTFLKWQNENRRVESGDSESV
jgi:3-mercaptopyruvate sulfurtransferase SseA